MKKSETNRSKENKKVKSSYNPIVPSVEQALRVLVCLGEKSGVKMRLTEICQEVEIHNSKGFSILNTLRQGGFVEKDPNTKTYSLGPFLLFLSRCILDHLDLRDIVTPFLEGLASETRSTALLGLINGDQVFVVAKKEAYRDMRVNAALGNKFNITTGAHGKAIVAFMPIEDRKRILSRAKLDFYGRYKPLNMKRLKDEFEEIRRLGFARDQGDLTPGINAVSSPVFGPTGNIIGCILLIGTFPENVIENYGFKVRGVAEQFSYKLGADIGKVFS